MGTKTTFKNIDREQLKLRQVQTIYKKDAVILNVTFINDTTAFVIQNVMN